LIPEIRNQATGARVNLDNKIIPPLNIESLLPERFIYQLGAYLQTCAHIEVAAAALISCLSGKMPEDDGWFEHYCVQRKLPTQELIKALNRCSRQAKQHGFSEELEILCGWLHRFKDNRHAAAHGAFFEHLDGSLRLDFTTRPQKNVNRFLQHTEPVTTDVITEALHDANRVHSALLAMLSKVEPALPLRIRTRIIPDTSNTAA
jgi:hypothetical protein